MKLSELMSFTDWRHGYGDLEANYHTSGEVVFKTPGDSQLLLVEDVEDGGDGWSASWWESEPMNLFRTDSYDSPNQALVAVFAFIFEVYPSSYWAIRGSHQQRLPLPLRTGLGEFVPQTSGPEIEIWRRDLGGRRYLELRKTELQWRLSLHHAPQEVLEVLRVVGLQVRIDDPVINVSGESLDDVEKTLGNWLWSLEKAGSQARKISQEIVGVRSTDVLSWHERLDDGIVE